MKKVVASKFESQVWLRDKYGNLLFQLEPDGFGYYKIPRGSELSLAPDDHFDVVEFESEVD